jgi:hypothetical protein
MVARALLVAVFALPALAGGQTAPAPTPPRPEASAVSTSLPVRRVVLYKTGIGYFEHLGRVRDRQDVTIRFTSAQLNDVLKSLTTIDLGRGQVTGISYNSMAPLDQRLGALRLPLDQSATAAGVLGALRGAHVEVTSGAMTIAGRLLSAETTVRGTGPDRVEVQGISIMTADGEMRTFDLTPSVRVRIAERGLRQELGRYLDIVGSTREQDARSMVISTTGSGERQLFVSYISEVPIWKSTYRLVLPEDKRRPLLQGWAIVDNTIGEDWKDVELSLVAGAPQSFIQELSQPYYGRRAVVPMPQSFSMAPQTHQGTLQGGTSSVSGVLRDSAGTPLPAAKVRLFGPAGEAGSSVTDSNGEYALSVPDGVYQLRAELPGFAPAAVHGLRVSSGDVRRQDITMRVGGLSESVTVAAKSDAPGGRGGRALGRDRGVDVGLDGGVAGGMVGGIPNAPRPVAAPIEAENAYMEAANVAAAAGGAQLGDLFEYRMTQPVTLAKDQSALVPILNAEVTVEKVGLWHRNSGSARPLRAVWLSNDSSLTLDGGSISIIDANAFAGEGLIEPLKPGERRLVSYAADLGVLVKSSPEASPTRALRMRAHDGILIQESEERATWTYQARSEESAPVMLVIEHPLRPGWTLASSESPAESTSGAARFRVRLEPRKDTSLVVREVRTGETRVSLFQVNDEWLTQVSSSGVSGAELERALAPVLEKQRALASSNERLMALTREQETITRDQARLRENMKALRGSAEEKPLLQRYARQLDAQETRLDTLKDDITKATLAQEAAGQELARTIATLSFDFAASK